MTKLLLLFLVTIALSNISISSISGTDDDHSFELISIDHLLTQHDPTLTPRDRRGLLRAEARERLFSGVDEGSYFMRLGVGTPPQNVYMSLDTGSDVVWLQCSPCKKCYSQSDPIFNPRDSSTFSWIACGGPRCKQLQGHFVGCGGKHKKICLYNANYGSGWFSQGAFSTETLTLGPGGNTKLRNISLGCGNDNRGWEFTKTAGVLGLGRGNLSFIMQTKDRFQKQFSYCLGLWYTNSSKSTIVFGPSAVTTRKDVYTPLIHTNAKDTYYYVNLTGISVDGTRVLGINSSISDVKPNGDGGVILDSGTKYTRLVKPAYAALMKAFRAEMNSTVGPPGNYSWFDTCYHIPRKLSGRVGMPKVELHFDKGASMSLGVDNTVILMDSTRKFDILCFAFMPNNCWEIRVQIPLLKNNTNKQERKIRKLKNTKIIVVHPLTRATSTSCRCNNSLEQLSDSITRLCNAIIASRLSGGVNPIIHAHRV